MKNFEIYLIKSIPLFAIGQLVNIDITGYNVPRKITTRAWNGDTFTWMYTFEGIELRCGEMYLSIANESK